MTATTVEFDVSEPVPVGLDQFPLLGLCDVLLRIGGIEVLTRGWRIVASEDGKRVRVATPRGRDAAGAWMQMVQLPEELRSAVHKAILRQAVHTLPGVRRAAA